MPGEKGRDHGDMRLKIILGNLLIVLGVGLSSYFLIRNVLIEEATNEVSSRIGDEATQLERSWRLSVMDFVDYVRDRAEEPTVRTSLGSSGSSRRTRVHEAANEIADWFSDPARGRGRLPNMVVMIDATGHVVARDGDPNRMHDKYLPKEVPAVEAAITNGEIGHDLWLRDGKVLQIAVAPIRIDERGIVGALLVAYEISKKLAENEKKVIGRDVAFIYKDGVYSSSMSTEDTAALQKALEGPLKSATSAALAGQKRATWTHDLGTDHWTGIVGPLAKTGSVPAAYIVAGNQSEASAVASRANIILILTGLAALLAILYGFGVGTSFVKPVEEIEEGVLAIINGNVNHRLETESSEFGGLAYRINQLVNVFTGVPEGEGDDGQWGTQDSVMQTDAESPAAASTGGGSGGGAVDDPAVAAKLAAVPEAEYLTKVYKDYVSAKQAAGEDVSNITEDRFTQRLVRNAQSLQKRHGCKEVRFQVESNGGHVVLKPVLIR